MLLCEDERNTGSPMLKKKRGFLIVAREYYVPLNWTIHRRAKLPKENVNTFPIGNRV